MDRTINGSAIQVSTVGGANCTFLEDVQAYSGNLSICEEINSYTWAILNSTINIQWTLDQSCPTVQDGGEYLYLSASYIIQHSKNGKTCSSLLGKILSSRIMLRNILSILGSAHVILEICSGIYAIFNNHFLQHMFCYKNILFMNICLLQNSFS